MIIMTKVRQGLGAECGAQANFNFNLVEFNIIQWWVSRNKRIYNFINISVSLPR